MIIIIKHLTNQPTLKVAVYWKCFTLVIADDADLTVFCLLQWPVSSVSHTDQLLS